MFEQRLWSPQKLLRRPARPHILGNRLAAAAVRDLALDTRRWPAVCQLHDQGTVAACVQVTEVAQHPPASAVTHKTNVCWP